MSSSLLTSAAAPHLRSVSGPVSEDSSSGSSTAGAAERKDAKAASDEGQTTTIISTTQNLGKNTNVAPCLI